MGVWGVLGVLGGVCGVCGVSCIRQQGACRELALNSYGSSF